MGIRLMAVALAVLAALAACDTKKKTPENIPRPRASGAAAPAPSGQPPVAPREFDD